MAKHKFSYFRATMLAILLAFCASVAALFVADVSYIDGKAVASALQSSAVRDAFVLTLVASLASTALAVLVAVPCGYALSRHPFRGAIVLDVMIDALIVLPPLIIGISLLVVFRQGTDLGIPGVELLKRAGRLLEDGGFVGTCAGAAAAVAGYILLLVGRAFAWLSRVFVYEVPGVVLAMFFCSASYAIRVMKATFDQLDPRTEQVAMTLGCTRAGAFRRVTLPLSRQGLIAAAVLSWARAVGIFGPVMIVAGAVEHRTQVLPTSIFLEISIGHLRLALAISMIMIAMAVVVLFALKTFSKSSLFGAGGTG